MRTKKFQMCKLDLEKAEEPDSRLSTICYEFTKSWTWLNNWNDWKNCCCYSVAKLYVTPCDSMDCRTPDFPVLHYSQRLLKLMSLSQWCHPTISPSVILFSSCRPSIRVFSNNSVLCIRWPKYWSYSLSISPSSEFSGLISLGLTALIFLLSRGLSTVFPSTTIQKHYFFGTQPSLWSNSHNHTWLLEKP